VNLAIVALTKVAEIEWAQVLNYLKASSHERGLLINFGAESLEHRGLFGPRTVRKESETKSA
jgi:GxxExxY protein